MPTLADFFNAPTELPLKDAAGNVVRTFKVRQPDQLEQGQYQRWLEQRAYDGIERRTYQDPTQQAADRAALNRDIAAGLFEYGGPVCCQALGTPGGIAKLLTIICADQGLSPDDAATLVDQQVREIAAVLWERGNDDPKALAAILKRLGLPKNYFSNSSSTRRSTGRSRKSRKRRTRN
jgi:hypothetical protein